MRKKKAPLVIGIDLGGTKVAAAVVNPAGRVLRELREPTDLSKGWAGLRAQLVSLCRQLKAEFPAIEAVGLASAGPLHAPSGKLLDPTNFGLAGAVIPIARQLEKSLKIPVRLENDAAAAALAEQWRGGAGTDLVCVTLGTGLGVGVVVNGKLVRGSRGLHPEAGHLLLNPADRENRCACGNYGCAEALLAGSHFGRRAAAQLKKPGLSAKDASELARAGDQKAQALFAGYGDLLGTYLFNLVTLFYPKKVVLTGSFAEAHDLFLPTAQERLKSLLERRLLTLPIEPKVQLSRLGNRAGTLGGAYIALHEEYSSC